MKLKAVLLFAVLSCPAHNHTATAQITTTLKIGVVVFHPNNLDRATKLAKDAAHEYTQRGMPMCVVSKIVLTRYSWQPRSEFQPWLEFSWKELRLPPVDVWLIFTDEVCVNTQLKVLMGEFYQDKRFANLCEFTNYANSKNHVGQSAQLTAVLHEVGHILLNNNWHSSSRLSFMFYETDSSHGLWDEEATRLLQSAFSDFFIRSQTQAVTQQQR